MYIVKKNKTVEKFTFPKAAPPLQPQPGAPTGPKRDKEPESDLSLAVDKIYNNCSRLLQIKIALNPNRA